VAAEAPGPVWAGSAPPLAEGFVHRPDMAAAIGTALVPGAAVVLASTAGAKTAGAQSAGADWRDPRGKTQLAVAAALSLWRAGEIELLVWVNASGRAAVLSAYAEAATALEGQASDDASAAAARFAGWLREATRPWLVVLDNLTEGAVPEDLWPHSQSGRLLVTTPAAARVSRHQSRLTVIPVGPFSRREALTYLMGRLKADVDQRQGAADLVSDLGDEPLALAQASAVIASSELTCHDYRDLVAQGSKQVIGDNALPAAISWTISVEHADLLSPDDAQPALVRAALLDGDGIPATVFGASSGASSSASADELRALELAGLLTVARDTTPPVVRMNKVVQAGVRAAMPKGMLTAAAKDTADALVESWPASDQPEWLARALRSGATRLREIAGDLLWDGGAHEVLFRAGHSLDAARLTGPAVEYWEGLAAVSNQLLGSEHPDTLVIREHLARANLAAGRTRESIDWFERIRGERARTLGPYDPATADASHDLGRALLAAGRAADAVGVLADALGGYERVRGPASVEALTAREDLAAAYRAAGQFDDAIMAYRRALADRERMQGKRHPDTLTTCRRLADSYLGAEQPKPAISLYRRLLDEADSSPGTALSDVTAIRDSLATAYYAAGRLASAIKLYEQVREDYTRMVGADHELTVSAAINLAHSYYAAGRLTDAAGVLRETVERCELTRPGTDRLMRVAKESLANITGSAGR
jgi:tetratricopeptide (TPR) repeat protein